MCHVFHKCQWYCCRCCALPYDLRNSSVFSARLNASSDDSDVMYVMCLTQVAQLMKMLKTIHDHKRKQERAVMRERAAQHQKQQARIEASRSVKRKERAKHAFYRLGQLEKRQNMDNS